MKHLLLGLAAVVFAGLIVFMHISSPPSHTINSMWIIPVWG